MSQKLPPRLGMEGTRVPVLRLLHLDHRWRILKYVFEIKSHVRQFFKISVTKRTQ